MKKLLLFSAIALTVCYPFIVYWGLQQYDAKFLLPILLLILAARWLAFDGRSERKVLLLTILGISIIVFTGNHQLGLKFYPVLMNLGFLILFASSLSTSTSFVERIARLTEPDLPPQAVIYTRKVTWAWVIFFVINGSIAAITALYASKEIWLLYNGLISYGLMAILAASEWLIRQRVKRSAQS